MSTPEPRHQPGARRIGSDREAGRFAYEGLERLFHERARLSIVASLASHSEGLIFTDLKMLCTLTDGNLSRQLQTLQEAGIIEIWKGTKNNRPQTLCRLTKDGARRFDEYVADLQRVVQDARAEPPRINAQHPANAPGLTSR